MRTSLLKRSLLAFVFLLGMTGSVLKAKTAAVKLIKYTHKAEGFSMRVPADWEIREDVTFQVYKIPFIAVRPLAGKNDTFRENLNVTIDKLTSSVKTQEYFEANLEQMPKSLGEYKEIEKGDLKKGFAGAKYLIYTHREKADDAMMKVVVFICVQDGKGYCLTCTASVDSYNKYQDLFFEIGKSFTPPKS